MTVAEPYWWDPLHPEGAADLFRDLAVPWWIAGGWALDLFAGRQTRQHGDLDVEVLRRDQFAVQRHLAGWDLHTAEDGELHPWRAGVALGAGINSIWCRRTPDAPWVVQIMFAVAEGETWHYRRHPAIVRPLATLGLRTETGIPFLAPEVQLAYKARAQRPKDDADFALIGPLLDQDRRAWLVAALNAAHPGHRWLAQLEEK
jgi:hypothetical protein